MTEKERFLTRLETKYGAGLKSYKPFFNLAGIAKKYGGELVADATDSSPLPLGRIKWPEGTDVEAILEDIYGELNRFEDELDRMANMSEADRIKEQLRYVYRDLSEAMDETGVSTEDWMKGLDDPVIAGFHRKLSNIRCALDMACLILGNWVSQEDKQKFRDERLNRDEE